MYIWPLSSVFCSVALASMSKSYAWSATSVLKSMQIALRLCMVISSASVDSSAQVQDGPSADQLPQMLADMCSQITIPIGSSIQRCHAILYKYDIGLAYFVTSDNGEIDLLGSPFMSGFASSACVRPATVFFEQIAGRQHFKSVAYYATAGRWRHMLACMCLI